MSDSPLFTLKAAERISFLVGSNRVPNELLEGAVGLANRISGLQFDDQDRISFGRRQINRDGPGSPIGKEWEQLATQV